MTIKESVIQSSIQQVAPHYKSRLFRNTVATFTILDKGKKRVIKTGLGKGSSDLIGYTKKIITKDMIGKEIAIFTAIETKKSDWKHGKKLNAHEQNQKQFINSIRLDGGISTFANCVEDFINATKKPL